MIKRLYIIVLFISCVIIPALAEIIEVDGLRYYRSENRTLEVAVNSDITGNIVIPEKVEIEGKYYEVTRIGENAFSNCRELLSIGIPNSVLSIGNYAFEDCISLTSVTIPNSVFRLGECCFNGCYGLTSLTIGNSVRDIGNSSFQECKGLTEVTIPNSVETIGCWAFRFCTGLKSVTISNSISFIGQSAFEQCLNLESLVIPNSKNTILIERDAFSVCRSLTSVKILGKVKTIGMGAFGGCNKIISVYYDDTDPIVGEEYIFSNNVYQNANLYVPEEAVDKCKQIEPWKYFNHIEAYDFTAIDLDGLRYRMLENETLEVTKYCNVSGNIEIPKKVKYEDKYCDVTQIGEKAFSHCYELQSITIPESIRLIGEYAFEGCSRLHSVNIPNSVTQIGSYAFSNCCVLKAITIPSSVTTITTGTFKMCRGLTSVTIPNSVTEIEAGAFASCSGLTYVDIPNSVNKIGNGAFSYCGGLKSVKIPNSVTSIDKEAFYACGELVSIYYSAKDPIASYSYSIFSYCTYHEATLYVPAEAVYKCKLTAPWEYFYHIEAYDFTGIDEVSADFDNTLPYEVYNLNGVMIGNSIDNLAPGIYIVRQGNTTKKININ